MHGRQRCYLEEQSQLQAAVVLQVRIRVQAVVHALCTHTPHCQHTSCRSGPSWKPSLIAQPGQDLSRRIQSIADLAGPEQSQDPAS